MIYVTGDTHGSLARLSTDSMPFASRWTRKDTLIVCGDFGFLFSGGTREETALRELSFRPYTILFVDGNHENFGLLDTYKPIPWKGGMARRLRRNIYHLMRGQVFELEGHTVFTMGGGFSIDRSRRYKGVDWWPAEMPGPEEYAEARKNLEHCDHNVDYIITHTAPERVMLQIFGEHEGEKELNDFLEWVLTNVSYKRWYFGHLHMDAPLDNNLYAMFLSVRELTTGNLVW
jgi:predicted phosphodiesterase